jgi:hypothetical protein
MRLSRFNYSGRTKGGDSIIALNVDEPGQDGLFGLRRLEQTGYSGAIGDKTLDLHGFDVEIDEDKQILRFWMINHRPPVDIKGKLLDGSKFGANSTIEVFELRRGQQLMKHLKTITHDAIKTPNGLVLTGKDEFVITNDKSDRGKS